MIWNLWRRLIENYNNNGMKKNIKKTILVANSEVQFIDLVSAENELKQVSELKYLASLLTKVGIGTAEIIHRIENSGQCLGGLYRIR